MSSDIIAFPRELGIVMEVTLKSSANVRKLLEFLDVIEETEFMAMPEQLRDRQCRAIDYHPGCTERLGAFFY